MSESAFLPNADAGDLAVALREAWIVGEALRIGESGHVGTWMSLVAVLRMRSRGGVPFEARELLEVAASEEITALVQSLATRRHSSAPALWKQVNATLRTIRRLRR